MCGCKAPGTTWCVTHTVCLRRVCVLRGWYRKYDLVLIFYAEKLAWDRMRWEPKVEMRVWSSKYYSIINIIVIS